MLELKTYPTKPKIAEYTSSLASHYTPVLNLRVSCVAVHLCELDLGLRTDTLWEDRVANEVSESLPTSQSLVRRLVLCSIAYYAVDIVVYLRESAYLSGSFSAKTFRFV